MTLAPPHALTSRTPGRPATATVTAVLVIHDGARWLPDCLDALALQTRAPDRLLVVDTGSTDDGPAMVAGHQGVAGAIGEVRVLTAGRDTSFGAAVGLAVAEVARREGPDGREDWLWLLHDDSAAAPFTLQRLLDTARRSPSVGVAGPKLVSWDDPGRLLEVGLQVTRSGRRTASPAPGEPDQGQHDERNDVLGVSSCGMLVRREVFDALGGFDSAFPLFRDDLDLSWRAHLAGHRVIVVPRATMRDATASARGIRSDRLSPGAARRMDRRHGRQVALARCSLAASPFLALWVLLASLGSAILLLALKRPRRAWAELADIAALGAPWRVVGARWRARRTRRVRRRDLVGLFVRRRVALRHTLDVVRDSVAFEPRDDAAAPAPQASEPVESGPVADEAEDLAVLPATWPQRIVRHPGVLAVVAATLMAVAAWRVLIHAGALTTSGGGVSGGALLPVVADASGLWHAYLDGWHGAALGNATEQAPWLAVLAGLAWVVGHLPAATALASPAAVALTWLLFAAMPLSALTAYLGARVLTHARWPRAWAALAWASLATLTTALGQGRIGAVVAHILLPLVAAGFACVARRTAGTSLTFGTALALALVGAFAPVLLVAGAVVALVLVVVGPGRARLSALVLLVVPAALLGPWLLRVQEQPLLLLAGPGLVQAGRRGPLPWELALLHPGGPGSYPVLLAAPVVLAGLVGLLRRGTASRAMTVLGVLAVLGLAMALTAGRVVIGHLSGAAGTGPTGTGGASAVLTPWSGTGLDLMALSLLAAAVLGLEGLAGRLTQFGFGWRQVLVAPVIAAAALATPVAATLAGWAGLGGSLHVPAPAMPAVAAEQASSALANRLLVLEPTTGDVGYRLLGVEPGPVVRDPLAAPERPDPVLRNTVAALLAETNPARANAARNDLFNLGIGFVGVRASASSELVRHLDATAGLTRLGDARGLVLWRVLPRPGAAADTTVPPTRVRVVNGAGVPVQSVDVSGAHGALATSVGAGPVRRALVVAEPPGWAAHALVTFDERPLRPAAGAAQPTYALPAHAGRVAIKVLPTHPWWRWGQLGLLALVVFLAVPFGNRRSRRAS